MSKTKRRPVIGITPAFDEAAKIPQSKETLYLRREYTKILESVGAIPLILNAEMPLEYVMQQCEGIIFSGGEDINPSFNNAPETLFPKEPIDRTRWEYKLIELCERQRKPMLGICYGMQLLAVKYGGVLHQDIQTEVPNSLNHNKTIHPISFSEDFLGLRAGSRYDIASRHHQSVSLPPADTRIAATAPDGIIEALAGDGWWGIQWHPESDETGIHIYRAFVERCMQ